MLIAWPRTRAAAVHLARVGFIGALSAILLAIIAACSGDVDQVTSPPPAAVIQLIATQTPAAAPTSTSVPISSPTATPITTAIADPSITPLPTATQVLASIRVLAPSPAPAATEAPSPTPISGSTRIPTVTPHPVVPPTTTPIPSPTPTPVPVATATATPTATSTPSATATPTPSATATLTPTPTPIPRASISLSPATGFRGSETNIVGSGFTPLTLTTITYTLLLEGQDDTSVIVNQVTTDANGAFSASFQIPYTLFSGDLNMIGAIDATGSKGASVMHVVPPPEITLSTASGAFGAAVSITGTGFLPNARPSALSLFGTNFLPDTASLRTDIAGTISFDVWLPQLLAGTGQLSLTVGSDTVSKAFQVLPGMITATRALQSSFEASSALDSARLDLTSFPPDVTVESVTANGADLLQGRSLAVAQDGSLSFEISGLPQEEVAGIRDRWRRWRQCSHPCLKFWAASLLRRSIGRLIK